MDFNVKGNVFLYGNINITHYTKYNLLEGLLYFYDLLQIRFVVTKFSHFGSSQRHIIGKVRSFKLKL
jgi:hypothetical protein